MNNGLEVSTARLILRPFTLDDASAVLRFSSDPLVTKYTGDKLATQNIKEAQAIIRDVWLAGYKIDGYARLAVVDKASGEVIGFCGLKYLPEYQMADIGYRFLPAYWGKGLGTESATAMMEYGFKTLKLEHIMGMAVRENIGSIKVLQKIGLKPAGSIVDLGIKVDLFKVGRQQYLAEQGG